MPNVSCAFAVLIPRVCRSGSTYLPFQPPAYAAPNPLRMPLLLPAYDIPALAHGLEEAASQ